MRKDGILTEEHKECLVCIHAQSTEIMKACVQLLSMSEEGQKRDGSSWWPYYDTEILECTRYLNRLVEKFLNEKI